MDSSPHINTQSFMEYNAKRRLESVLQDCGFKEVHASLDDVRKIAETRSNNIFSSYATLHDILLRHEATIQRRWTKKKEQKRQKFLLDAWPNMAEKHTPDLQAYLHSTEQEHLRDCYLVPQINQEDLIKPRPFLLLLKARGHNPPPEFASVDFSSMSLGVITKAIEIVMMPNHFMALNGASNADEYGKLLEISKCPDASEWLRTGKQFPIGPSLLVLEAQEKIMRFLVTCCRNILHDIPACNLTADCFPIRPEPYLETGKESYGFNSLAEIDEDVSYQPSSKLDLDTIELVLSAKLSALEDNLWAVREDPGYFLEQLIEHEEHRIEQVKDANGHGYPSSQEERYITLCAHVCSEIITESYLHIEVISELYQQVKTLQLLQTQSSSVHALTNDGLPGDLMNALLKFRFYLDKTAQGFLMTLQQRVIASPQFRRYHVRHPYPEEPPDSCWTILQLTTGPKMSIIERKLFKFLCALCEAGASFSGLTLQKDLDYLGTLLKAQPDMQELISPMVASLIGDIFIIAKCMDKIDSYEPWKRYFRARNYQIDEVAKVAYKEFIGKLVPFNSAFEHEKIMHIANAGYPFRTKFAYPYEKRRTKRNIERLQLAEKHLAEFWKFVDQRVESCCKGLKGMAIHRILSQSRAKQRTPDWVDPAPSPAKALGREPAVDPSVAQLNKPMSTIYIGEPAGNTKDKAEKSTVKTKEKMREESFSTTTEQASAVPEEEPTPEPTQIPVDSRSLKVFQTLFFKPTTTSSPGEIPWAEFLHAMASTDMYSIVKLYGSIWQFHRRQGDRTKIQFHEPHPRGKIRFIMARRYGRRLSRAFGWDVDTFVLKEK
ncbi:uncharacterized protein F4812DRAFT_315322 [Daldinia caldariorum]|uniref:uncharacterized protein n=1 Tax=Daldinia caldariorum TaxID=326644 RepID=UPI002008B5E8|nr:uncharacterized protein F4812DRAFT_315322 [Daldinia caldariorum]KAI1470128.1 hypothetical protein F4812DRAFT_315322 [Daldinia caldariorum]